MLKRNERWKIRRGWLAAGCALALVVCAFCVQRAGAQSASSGGAASQKAKGSKAANPAATKVTSTKASAGKAHTAPPTAAGKKVKASATISRGRRTKLVGARTGSTKSSGKKISTKKTARGQQKIDPERAQAIQEALIREHYLSGDAAGTWNQASEDAMRKYQADHGWQSKTVPDSRALISLGLGPSHDHLLNPESAMTTGPDTSHAASVSSSTQSPVSHSTDPGAGMATKLPSDLPPATTPERNPSSPQ
jgi:hypothetical protein